MSERKSRAAVTGNISAGTSGTAAEPVVPASDQLTAEMAPLSSTGKFPSLRMSKDFRGKGIIFGLVAGAYWL
jgi:hypothetical protein